MQPAGTDAERLRHDRVGRVRLQDLLTVAQHPGRVVDEHALKGAGHHLDAREAQQLGERLPDRLAAEVLGRADRMVHRSSGRDLVAVVGTGVPVDLVAARGELADQRQLRRHMPCGRHGGEEKRRHLHPLGRFSLEEEMVSAEWIGHHGVHPEHAP